MRKQHRTGKQYYRLVPCPSYDIAGTENWLSDLSEEGLFLSRDGFFAGFAAFECNEPQRAEYRLEAIRKNVDVFSEDEGPSQEEIELSEKYSWEYVARRGDFYVYRSMDASARELDTDPQVQALALNSVKKRRLQTLILSLCCLIVYPLILMRGGAVYTAVTFGPLLTAALLLFAALLIAETVRSLIYLRKAQTALSCCGQIPAADRRKYAPKQTAWWILRVVVILLLICAALRLELIARLGSDRIPLEEYTGDLPFATIKDMAGEGWSNYEYISSEELNWVEERHGVLAPRIIVRKEYAAVKMPGGRRISGGLCVEYYKMKSPWLAGILAGELHREDRLKPFYEAMDAPDIPADRIAAYINDHRSPTVVMQKGNIVVRAYFQNASDTVDVRFQDWTAALFDSLKQ